MIGSQKLTFTRKFDYFYRGVAGTNKTPLAQPNADGCYLRVEGAGAAGSIVVTGTSDRKTTTETINTFDTDYVGFGSKLWTAITKFDLTGFIGQTLTIYPASESKDKINLDATTTVTIMCNVYVVNETQFKGVFELPAGETYRSYREVMYDRRYTLQNKDTVTLDGREFSVASIDSRDSGGNIKTAFLIGKRL